MRARDKEDVSWITCPECGAKIGLILSVGKHPTIAERPAAEPEERPPADIRESLATAGVDLTQVEMEEEEDKVIISPKTWLGDDWRTINDAIRAIGGSWISQGRDSRWEIRKENLK